MGGGLFNLTMKSGTNTLHGSVYDYFTNEAFNASHGYLHTKGRDRKHDWGVTLGGPVYIPKIYDGRDKTFFFFNFEQYRTTRTYNSPVNIPPMAFREGAEKASPVLLEPIMNVEIVTPDEYMGDVNGDLNRRRGVLLGMDESPAGKIIKAEVPLAEMFGYATDVRSMSQGRATYSMEFSKYAEVPPNVSEGIIRRD